MTKRLIALLLSLMMVLACFVGCGKDEDPLGDEQREEASLRAKTLSMYVMTEEEVSEEQAAAVQAAINTITQSKFKTKLILHFYTEENYYEAVEAALYSDDSYTDDVVLKEDEESNTEEETYVDEYGVVQIKYPDPTPNQIDIFYLEGFERLSSYIENELVSDLTTEVESASKILNTYIHPGYIKGMDATCDGIYAIPANAPIGEYTYMLLNKEILKEYNHVPSDFESLFCSNMQQLLGLVDTYNQDIVPLRSFTESGNIDLSYIRYFGTDENGYLDDETFSLLGGYIKPTWKYMRKNHYTRCVNIFNDTDFTSQMKTLLTYKENGYYGTEDDADKKFAVGYIKGGVEVYEQYGDEYEIVVCRKPELKTMDAFNNMYAVSATSTDVPRSMQIISYLYTNEDFLNTLLYGVEDENYELVNSDMLDANGNPYQVVRRLEGNTYVVAPEKVGNILHALPTEDQAPNLRDIYMAQNLDANYSLILGFTHNYNGAELSYDHTNYLREVSMRVYTELQALNTVAEFEEYAVNIKKECASDEMLSAAMKSTTISNGDDGSFETLPTLYRSWLDANNLPLVGLETEEDFN